MPSSPAKGGRGGGVVGVSVGVDEGEGHGEAGLALETGAGLAVSARNGCAATCSGHGASSLQHSHPCALPMSSDWPTYQYGFMYHIERDGVSTQSYTARDSQKRLGLRAYSPSLSCVSRNGRVGGDAWAATRGRQGWRVLGGGSGVFEQRAGLRDAMRSRSSPG